MTTMAIPQRRMLPVVGQFYLVRFQCFVPPRTQICQMASIAQRYSCQFATTEAGSTSVWRVIEDLPDQILALNASSSEGESQWRVGDSQVLNVRCRLARSSLDRSSGTQQSLTTLSFLSTRQLSIHENSQTVSTPS